jgi:tetratricopeptide (TPR) repeat protein
MTIEEQLEVAGVYMEKGRVGDAADQYRTILAEDPQNFEANLNLAVALTTMENAKFANERDYFEARQHLRMAFDVRPGDARPYIQLGKLDFESGAYRDAISNLSVATGLDPASELAHEVLGRSFIEVGMRDEGEEELLKTLAINPGNEAANFELGRLYERAGKNGPAMRHLEKALEVNPNLDMAVWLLERIYYEEGFYERAEATCRRFLKYHPDDIQSLEVLGWVYRRQERTAEMLEIYARLTSVEPANTGYWSPLIQHYMEHEDYERARPILERSLKHNPYYAYGNVRYGQVLIHYADESLTQGDRQEAIHLLSEAKEHLEKAKVDDRYHATASKLIDHVSARIRQASGK